MKNSNKYRKPPLRRTRDSFIDDRNSIQNPRTDFGDFRHLQVRRDKDKTRSLGVTLYDVDFAIKSFIDNKMQIRIEDYGEYIPVPTIYANAEKWASIQKDGFLKDKKGKTLAPLITFRRSSVNIKSEMRRNKVANTNQIAYIMRHKYNTTTPYDRFSTQYGAKRPSEYFMTPMPDYVDITYDFIIWCEYQNQLNYIVENFVYFSGQAFGDKNFFKFSTNMDSISMEDSNTTGQDRIVRASFQITAHAYLLPKDIAAQTTTKRLVTANKIVFVSEAFSDINSVLGREKTELIQNSDEFNAFNSDARRILGAGQNQNGFRKLNKEFDEELRAYEDRIKRLSSRSSEGSPGIYPQEFDNSDG
jgi:hypothetical protein